MPQTKKTSQQQNTTNTVKLPSTSPPKKKTCGALIRFFCFQRKTSFRPPEEKVWLDLNIYTNQTPFTFEGIRLDVYTLEDERLEPTNHPF